MNMNHHCSCESMNSMTEHGDMTNMVLAMAYVPWQQFDKLYEDLQKAYKYGLYTLCL